MTSRNVRRFDALEVKAQCNGMLPPEVYHAMYEAACGAPAPVFVEVGTAHAAGTVSLAMGLRDSGRMGVVYTFEKITGGSREAFGSVEENIKIIKGNLSAFGVDEIVRLNVGDVAATCGVVPQDTRIGLLCLDADGAIDRDFGLFFNRLVNDAVIIVDDMRDHTRMKFLGRKGLGGSFRVDQKHRLTFKLMDLFRHHELIDAGAVFGTETWIGKKGPGELFDVPSNSILEVYRSLTFSEADMSLVPFRGQVTKLLRRLAPEGTIERLKRFERGD
jgi:predicted O-methyltransferase YrrM